VNPQEETAKTLLLVDGSSYLYRAFHALPDLKNAQGEPTGAISGVLSMLRRLSQDYKAEARACVFDTKAKTFRDDAYPEYKAHRSPMPDDLVVQIEPLKLAIAAMGWPVIGVDGVEADDVIATLAERAKRAGMRCVISTGDKDLAQLVDEQVTLVNTMTNEKLDIEGVKLKFGVPPELIVDFYSLVGDAVDNVPGVPKVGPKTAVKWIQQYGSLDAVVANAGEIGGVVGENLTLEQGYEAARYSVLTTLAAVKYALGDLDRVQQIVHLTGFVNSAPGFNDQPRVINGAADLLVEIYGDRGKPTRAAIGCRGLGGNACVEIIVQLLFSGSDVRPPLARDHFAK